MRLDEVCSIHPAFIGNAAVQQRFLSECSEILKEQAARDATKFMRLVELAKAKSKNPAEFNAGEFSKLRKQLDPMFKQLEAVINRLLDKKEPPVPALLPQLAKKNGTAIRLNNILIRLINISEINCPLTKAILRLFGRFTAITQSDLETWKLTSSKIKLEAQGDSEIKDLIGAVFQIAAKNGDGKDSPARDMKPASTTKKAIKSTAKPSSASAPTTASASLGAKRVREDDANGDGRSGKKQAIGTSTPASGNGSTPATSLSAKLPSSAVAAAKASSKTTTSASTTSTTATAAATVPSKRSLLLPGKAVRAPTKVPVKPDLPKADAQKMSANTEPATKAPAAKTEAPKLVPAKTAATQPAPQAADTAKAARLKVAPEPPKSSKFAALMAEIYEPAKMKALEPAPVAAADPNETEDQKKRRLRKEERRRLGLKVTFKSDDRLVEIREFTRDPEEIRFSAPVRDVRSENKDKMEGMALRKSHAGEIRPWEEPIAIDFDVIPQEKRIQTFVTRGGIKTFHTEQQKFNEDRETKELMVIYTDPADIPPTPKSPAYEPSLDYDDSSASVISLPETVEYDEIRQRNREWQHLGLWRSIEAALVRLDAKSRPDYADFTKALQSVNSIADSYNGLPVPNKPDIQSLTASATSADDRDQQTYQLLTSDRPKNYRDPEPYDPTRPRTGRRHDYRDAGFQRVADQVENLFAQFSGVPAYSQPAETVTAQPTVAQPAVPDYTAAWAQYYAQQAQQQQQPQAAWYNQQQQAAYTQPANPYQQPQAVAPVAQQQQNADAGNQLSAILGALGNPSTTGQPQHPPQDPSQIQAAVMALLAGGQQLAQAPAPAADPQSAEYLLSLMNWAQGQGGSATTTSSAPPIPAPAYSPDQSSAGSRSHQHSSYGQSSYGQSQQDRDGYGGSDNRDRERDRDRHNNNRGGSGKGKYSDVPDHLRGINRSLIGTKLCTFYAKGQCAKGDKCTFRHE
jgi:hypothetical protein